MAAPPEAGPKEGAGVDSHPIMRVQFFLRGPFDPLETFSVTFLDDQSNVVESVVLGGEFAQYELWNLVARVASDFQALYGTQGRLAID